MTMQPYEYPVGMVPTCDCSRRGTLATVVTHGSDRCARCYERIAWVPGDPVPLTAPGPGQMALL